MHTSSKIFSFHFKVVITLSWEAALSQTELFQILLPPLSFSKGFTFKGKNWLAICISPTRYYFFLFDLKKKSTAKKKKNKDENRQS